MIFFNSQKLIDNLIADLDLSQSSIDIEVYILDPDDIGKKFEQALIRAVKRGVKVRLMVDRIGSFNWIRYRMSSIVQMGIEVRVFRPFPGLKTLLYRLPQVLVPFFAVANRRNHRKVFIIDHKIAYVGSFNIMEPALRWKETTVRIESASDIDLLMEIFNNTWNWIKDGSIRYAPFDFTRMINSVAHSKLIKTTQTKTLRKRYRRDFLRRINQAQQRIWLVTPYFNPPRFLLKALLDAVKRGVDVRLMVPKKTDPSWFSYLSRLYYSPLIKRCMKVYEYEHGILHSKTALIDSEGVIGSGNLNYRSFYHDLELNVIITDPKEVEQMEKEFIRDMALSYEIKKPEDLKTWEKIFGSFLTLFKTSF